MMKTTTSIFMCLAAMVFFFSVAVASAQQAPRYISNINEYQQLKQQRNLNGAIPRFTHGAANLALKVTDPAPHTSTVTSCNCWQERDASWNVVPFDIGVAPDYRNDDGSTDTVNLPFNFCFYGGPVNQVFINNNGNVSIGAPYYTFTPTTFPDPTFVMIAPFWSDVDTRGRGGIVWYQLTATHLIVQWDYVDYFNADTTFATHSSLYNTYQLIMTDGTDPILPSGNVSFCYKDMQWTTGDASLGTGGFGGSPATVGINRGNGIDYVQIGLFDAPGSAYDGPYGNNDGVDFMDNQSLLFDACLGGSNEAPLLSSAGICDTLLLCVGDSMLLTSSFYSPEAGQITTDSVNSNGMTGVTVVSNIPGNTSVTTTQIIGQASNVGYNSILIYGTDNGVPPQTTTGIIYIHVVATPTAGFIYSPAFPAPGQPISFTNTSTPAGTFFLWDFGDGSATTVTGSPVHTYTTAGTYTVTLTASNPAGCINVYQVQIVVAGCALTATISATNACEGSPVTVIDSGNASVGAVYTWDFGGATVISGSGGGPYQISYGSAGTATITVYVNDGGCLDTATTTLTVFPLPTSPTITQGGDTLFTGQGYTTYQWYFGSTPIVGATQYYYLAAQSGNYNLIVGDENGCQVGAGILNVIAAVKDIRGDAGLSVFPNPARGEFTIYGLPFASSSIELYNILGVKVYSAVVKSKQETVNCKQFSSGIYLLKISGGEKTLQRNIVIEK